jgi:preprotein translocase subunit SecG
VLTFPLIAALGQAIFKLLLSAMAIFLILLVLVQRGRGGGLAGALGGMGGSSAFGAKAGDVFTRVTIVAAAIWILLCIIAANVTPSSENRINTGGAAPASTGFDSGPAMTGPAAEEDEAADVAEGEADAEPASGGETASEDAASGDETQE